MTAPDAWTRRSPSCAGHGAARSSHIPGRRSPSPPSSPPPRPSMFRSSWAGTPNAPCATLPASATAGSVPAHSNPRGATRLRDGPRPADRDRSTAVPRLRAGAHRRPRRPRPLRGRGILTDRRVGRPAGRPTAAQTTSGTRSWLPPQPSAYVRPTTAAEHPGPVVVQYRRPNRPTRSPLMSISIAEIPIIDTDTHVVEPPDLWTSRLSSQVGRPRAARRVGRQGARRRRGSSATPGSAPSARRPWPAGTSTRRTTRAGSRTPTRVVGRHEARPR